MEKGMYEPEEKTPAWILIALLRPVVDGAIEAAGVYMERMLQEREERLQEAAETDGSESSGSAVTQATSDFVRGRLRCGPGFEVVTVDGVAYNLHTRPKARLCIQYLFENGAFDAASARHLIDEIDPFVREQGGYPRAAEIKIQHYFNSQDGELPELCKQLIGVVHGKGRYSLKVE